MLSAWWWWKTIGEQSVETNSILPDVAVVREFQGGDIIYHIIQPRKRAQPKFHRNCAGVLYVEALATLIYSEHGN
jgi:hypothetical protein